MTKVSILVPIYNVEKYLPECLDSLISQTLSKIEIICINDGSTDSSLKVIKQYQKKDPRIVLIDKPNTGYGDSMNHGLEKAQSEYIAIVESDDFAEKTLCEALYNAAKKHDADVVRANYFYHSARNCDEIHEAVKKQPEVASIEKDFQILYEEPAIWSGIYRRKFLLENNIRFRPTPGASYQDTGFNFKALVAANKIAYIKTPLLHYRVDNSSSSVKNRAKLDMVVGEFAEIEDFLQARKKQLPKKIFYVEQAAKFGAYHWNLQRLDDKLMRDFARRIKQEFKQAQKQNLLKKAYFPKHYWVALQMILKMPLTPTLIFLKTRMKLKGRR